MIISFIHNGVSYEGWTLENASDSGVPDDVIDNAIIEKKWEQVRHRRDYLVSKTDFTQMPDSPLSAEQKQAFADYRQALRDLPQKFDNPDDVIWPDKPTI